MLRLQNVGQNQVQPMKSMLEIWGKRWLCRDRIKQFLFYSFVSLQSEEKSTGNEINGIPCNYVMSTVLLSSCNITRNLNTILNVWYVRLLISKLARKQLLSSVLKRLFSNSQRNLGFADSRSEGRTSIAFCTETILYVYDESSQIPVEAEDTAGEWEDDVLLLPSNMISAKTITVSQRLVNHSRLVHYVSSYLEGNRSLTTSTDNRV